MKRIIFLFAVFAITITACQNYDEEIKIDEIGMVVDYAGAGNCGIVIELENGARIQPLYYPKELINVVPSCDRGTPAEIVFVEELNCAPYVDLYFSNYDSLARDPIYIHEAFVDGNCLQIKVSYSGGCKTHTIDLARMHPWTASSSTVPTFEIRHNANGDMCEAYFTKELRFDLTSLKLEGKKEFVLVAKLTDGTTYNKLFELK